MKNFAEKLQEGASMFEKQAGALKNKFWLENMKVKNDTIFLFAFKLVLIKINFL